tara:strand:- start:1758 stop:1901 length:144 start_codon:yes stop_codon:yes gene_type:complete
MKKKHILYLVLFIFLALFYVYVDRYGKETEKRIEEYKKQKDEKSLMG